MEASEEAEQEAAPEDPEIDIDGQKVKLSELRAGYMKDADYRRKTAEVAEAKRQAEAIQQRIAEERNHYANHLDVVLQNLQTQLIGDQAALAKLAQENPDEWVRQNAQFQQRYADYQKAVQERQALHQRMSAEQEAQQLEWRKAEREALYQKLPEWKDSAKAKAEQELVAGYLLEAGYKPDELENLFDHRALIVARDAALYRQLKSAKSKQVKNEPTKPVKPGTAADPKNKRSDYHDALARARKTGRPEDIERALLLKGT